MPKISTTCLMCNGTGMYETIPCPFCDGDGNISCTLEVTLGFAKRAMEIAQQVIDKLPDMDAKLDSIITELDYIHGKVTAIWNQVKPGQ